VLADFARILCLEPSDQQQSYDMTREAFDLSERFRIPVMVRLVTRLCHGRALVAGSPPREQNPVAKAADPAGWTLLPAISRRLWRNLLDLQPGLEAYSEECGHNALDGNDGGPLGVVTAGVARHYLEENLPDLDRVPPHMHIGSYPLPERLLRDLADRVDRILVLEDGYPFVERRLRGVLPHRWEVSGRLDGTVPADGELTPDSVRASLGLPARPRVSLDGIEIPGRPPQLCRGCPHRDSYEAVNAALEGVAVSVVASDIGCYTLGALPPYRAIESCVCMGASIGMAKGASDAGLRPSLAVIGDSTFLHSGVTGLMDVVAGGADITLLILDNGTVAMTGLQPTVLGGDRFRPIVEALGVDPGHVHTVEIGPRTRDDLTALLRREMDHPGPSVIVAVRECVESAKAQRRLERTGEEDS
jgi:indolepyruvate ferredoxin oxidoreductase alpha subunit